MSLAAETIFAELQHRHDPGKREVMADLDMQIAQDNAALRGRFLRDIATFTAAELAQAAGDRTALRRWLAEQRVFSVPVDDGERFPAFQFAGGQPLPVIGDVLAALSPTWSAWEIAFWFVSSNSWLGGPTPVAHLSNPAWVLSAARHENDEIGG